LKIKSAQHRKLHPVLKTRYAEFVGYYRLSKNRNHKTSNTVKSPTAIETPAVSEELENISKIKWDTGNSSTTEKLLAYLHHGQENDVQYAGAEALALRADPRVYSTLRKVYSKLRSGRRGFNVKNEKWR